MLPNLSREAPVRINTFILVCAKTVCFCDLGVCDQFPCFVYFFVSCASNFRKTANRPSSLSTENSLQPVSSTCNGRSGTVLRDPEPLAESSPALPSLQDQHGIAPSSQRLRLSQARPPVRVLSASVPAESLSHLRQSYVGANPLQLAAFRRLVDATTPPSKNPKRDIDSFLIGGGIGGPTSRTDWVPDGWGSAHAPETVSKLEMAGGDDQGEGTGRRARGSDPITDAWRARQLERAGCLIEVESQVVASDGFGGVEYSLVDWVDCVRRLSWRIG